eukprot:jgi/Ulvmu1/10564/UM065_0018.1
MMFQALCVGTSSKCKGVEALSVSRVACSRPRPTLRTRVCQQNATVRRPSARQAKVQAAVPTVGDVPTLQLAGHSALRRQCLQTILSQHGVSVEETIPVRMPGTWQVGVGDDVQTSSPTLTPATPPGTGVNEQCPPQLAAAALLPLPPIAQDGQAHRAVAVETVTRDPVPPTLQLSHTDVPHSRAPSSQTMAVPPARGPRLTLARVVQPAEWHFTVHIRATGEVLGHISEQEHAYALPSLFWDGQPDCCVQVLGPDSLENTQSIRYKRFILPRKILFLRLCAIAHISRKALRPWEEWTMGSLEDGPDMAVSGYVTPESKIIVCDADAQPGGPPTMAPTTVLVSTPATPAQDSQR